MLVPTLGGAAGAGMLFSPTGPLGAGLAAVLGGLGSYSLAYRMCGAQSTKGGFRQLLSAGRLPKPVVQEYEKNLVAKYGISGGEARYVTQAAVVYLRSGGQIPEQSSSAMDRRHGVHLLLRQGGLRA